MFDSSRSRVPVASSVGGKPRVKSPNLYLLEGKIVGLDDAMARALKAGRFDYDAPIDGLQVIDRIRDSAGRIARGTGQFFQYLH